MARDEETTQADATLGGAVAQSRAAGFVGRAAEMAALDELLSAEPPFRVWLITGASGVGKSVLLQALQRSASVRAVAARLVDARDLPGDAAELGKRLDTELAATGERGLLVLDTVEHIVTHERWLRESWLPCVPEGTRVILAGRWTPATAWTTDPGWAALTRVDTLSDFSADETAECLEHRGLERAQAGRVQDFTRGHPLAVNLAANVLQRDPERVLEVDTTPEIVRALVGHLLDDASGPIEQHALYVAGLVRNLSADLLTAMLDLDDPRPLFDWLRGQSFMRVGPHGLRPHELVGEALRAELRWRQPALHRDLVRRCGAHLLERLRDASSEVAFLDYLYPLREFPAMQTMGTIVQDTGLYTDEAGDADLPVLADLVEHHEGAVSRGWFDFWTAREPGGITVLRDADRQVIGFTFFIDISAPDAAALADPSVQRVTDYLARTAPLRPGERAHLYRFTLDAEAYQARLSPAVSQLVCSQGFHPFRWPDLAFQATIRGEDEMTRKVAHLSAIPPLEGCEFRLDNNDFFIAGHDWRTEPPADWLRGATERILASTADTSDDTRHGTILSEGEFREAVRAALKARSSDSDLSEQPLAASCLVRARTGNQGDAGSALASILDEGIETLAQAQKTESLVRVLDRSYRNAAPKQRAAAAALNLSYGTYRRRLRAGIAALSDHLWSRELEASRRADE